jgi:hypothetical protein
MNLRKLLAMAMLILSPLMIAAVSLMIPNLVAVLGVMLLTQGQGPVAQLGGTLLLAFVLWNIFGSILAIARPPSFFALLF